MAIIAVLAMLFAGNATFSAPTPARRPITIAPLGDSRTAIIHYDGTHLNMSTMSHLNWANVLNEQKYPCTGNFGISGAISDKILEKMLAPALATHATYMTILMGVNDVKMKGYGADHTMANIAKAADAALAHGTIPILFTDPGAEHYPPPMVEFINDVNERIKAYCAATPKAVLFDMAALVSRQRTPTIVFQPGWSHDGVHLQTLGACKVGVAFAALMDSLGVSTPSYPGLQDNLLANPEFSGTSGTIGAGNMGTLPDKYIADHSTCTFSVKKREDGSGEIVAAMSNSGMRISQALPVEGFNPGDALQAGTRVDIEGGSVNLLEVRAQVDLVFADGTFTTAYCFGGTSKHDTISSIGGPLSLTLQSPANPYPAGKVLKSVTFRLSARIPGQGSATLHFRNPWCKAIRAAAPAPAVAGQ